jgi:hypothetical protein
MISTKAIIPPPLTLNLKAFFNVSSSSVSCVVISTRVILVLRSFQSNVLPAARLPIIAIIPPEIIAGTEPRAY